MSDELKEFAKQFGYKYEVTIDFPDIVLTEEDTKIPSLKTFMSDNNGTLFFQQNGYAMKYLDLLCKLKLTNDRRKKKNIKRKIKKLKLNARKTL